MRTNLGMSRVFVFVLAVAGDSHDDNVEVRVKVKAF